MSCFCYGGRLVFSYLLAAATSVVKVRRQSCSVLAPDPAVSSHLLRFAFCSSPLCSAAVSGRRTSVTWKEECSRFSVKPSTETSSTTSAGHACHPSLRPSGLFLLPTFSHLDLEQRFDVTRGSSQSLFYPHSQPNIFSVSVLKSPAVKILPLRQLLCIQNRAPV